MGRTPPLCCNGIETHNRKIATAYRWTFHNSSNRNSVWREDRAIAVMRTKKCQNIT